MILTKEEMAQARKEIAVDHLLTFSRHLMAVANTLNALAGKIKADKSKYISSDHSHFFHRTRISLRKRVGQSHNYLSPPYLTPDSRNVLRMLPCFYCGAYGMYPERTLDHFIPKAYKGVNRKVNLVPACNQCNSKKGNRLPYSWEILKFRRQNPTVTLMDLLEPWGFLTDDQQAKLDRFMDVWCAHGEARYLKDVL